MPANSMAEASELNVEEGVNPRLPTAYYHSDMPPPAPELDRGGIVVTDITAQFRNAASSRFMPQAQFTTNMLMSFFFRP